MLQEHAPSHSENDRQKRDQGQHRSLRSAILARSGTFAYLPIIVAVILLYYGASWQIFEYYTDAARYQCYALAFWLGSRAIPLLQPAQCHFIPASALAVAPLHMLPLEYPPLTLAIFSIALLSPLLYYQVAFALWMAIAAIALFWLLQRFAPRGSALTFACFLLAGAWATAEGRFDLVPAGLTLLSIIAAERSRWTWAYIALAAAVLLKIYPILLFPAFFIAEQRDAARFHTPQSAMSMRTLPGELWRTLCGIGRWQWKNSAFFFGLIIAITGLFALINAQGALVSQLSYFADRPIQIESTGGSIVWIASLLGIPARAVYTFGSLNLESKIEDAVSQVSTIAFLLGCLVVVWQQWRARLDVVQACIALLLVYIATGKVFSPQYLIWILPLLAYAYPLDLFWFPYWLLVSLLTSIIYPFLYTRVRDVTAVYTVPGFMPIVSVRDALIMLLTIGYLFNWFGIRTRRKFSESSVALASPA